MERAADMTRLGIIGGGQLARMLVLKATELGIRCSVLDPKPDAGAGQLAAQIVANYDDQAGLQQLLDNSDVLTYDFENVPAAALSALSARERLAPGVEVLHVAQDRLREKQLFRQLGIAVGEFFAVNSRSDLLHAIEHTGYPAVLKTRRLGYDGKGQVVLREPEDLERAWQQLGDHDLILEAFIDYQYECSIIGVRSRAGEVRCYPLTINHHEQGILRASRIGLEPAQDALQQQAESWLAQIADEFHYVGVLTLELFVSAGNLLANEIAPRVHNSGHWSIDAADCSQFENHLRAVTGLPLGPVTVSAEALMINFIGAMPDAQRWLTVPGLHWHDYGKQPRALRKVGHATLCARNRQQLQQRLQLLESVCLAGEMPQLSEQMR